MTKSLELKLVDGTFTVKEAKEVLINLYSDKIRFHEMKNFSSRERNGTDDAKAVIRLAELHAAKNMINQILTAVDPGDSIRMQSNIHIEFLKHKE